MRVTMVAARSGFLAVCICCALACSSGSDGNSDNNSNGTATAATFLTDVQSALCQNTKTCNPGFEFLFCDGSSQFTGGNSEDPGTAVAAGRATFDSAKAQQCIADIKAAPCSNGIVPISSTCDDVFKGTVAAGGTCFVDQECKDGFCAIGNSCPGTCSAFAAAGADCSTGARCGSGLFCDDSGKCAATKANAAECNRDEECQSGNCDVSAQPSTCVPASSSAPGTALAGAACKSTADCASGLYCKSSAGGPGTCAALIAKGAKCGENGDFSGAQEGCANHLVCAGASASFNGAQPTFVAGTCSDWSNVAGPCTQAPQGSLIAVTGCMFGLVCGSDGKCAKPPSTGTCAADPSFKCASGAFCDDADNTCKAQKAGGADCTDGSECLSGSCVNGKCSAEDTCKP